jgi:chromatin remodeling complex protein RSC6
MSNTSTGTSTMSKNTSNTSSVPVSSSASKKVNKKSDAPVAASVAAPAPVAAASVAAPAPAAPAQEKSSKKSKPVVASSPAPLASTAPVANPVVEAVAVEQRTVEQEISALVSLHQQLRDQAVAAIKNLQRLQKRVAKELKEAGRRRRRSKKEDDGVVREKRPTIFTTPVTLKDELCGFLGKPKGSQMTPADVTRAFSAYVDSHKLKDAEKGHTIHPDPAMRKVLGVKDGESVTYRNIQSYLYKLYVLPEKKKPVNVV